MPAIPFCEPKVDEDDDDDVEMVDICGVMIDPVKGSSDKTNINVKTFPGITNLMGAGLEVLKLRWSLNIYVFKPKGLVVGSLSIEKRLSYFEQFLKSSAKLQWSTAFVKCQKQVLSGLLTATDNVTQIRQVLTTGTRKAFYAYLASTESLDMNHAANKKLKGASLQRAKDGLVTPEFKCLSFDRALWFHLHKTMWTKSCNVFSEQELQM